MIVAQGLDDAVGFGLSPYGISWHLLAGYDQTKKSE
jgi:hypothetical protein